MSKSHFYNSYKLLFIHDETRPSLRDFAKKQGIEDTSAFLRFAEQQDWVYLRDHYWQEHEAVVRERMLALQVNDSTRKLREIQALKARAWEGAFAAELKTADKAISSYSELEKLERLILGQSTQNLSVGDVEQYMLAVVKVLKEEINDAMVLEQVRVRLSGLTLGNAQDVLGADQDQSLN